MRLLILIWMLVRRLLRVSLPPNDDREAGYAFTDTDDTWLGRALREAPARPAGSSGFYLLPGGVDAFAVRAVFAWRAERSIDAQYYLLHDDLIGKLFVDLLLRAAERGVRVRLLLDDMALNPRKDVTIAALDTHPNIEIRVFNPFGRGGSRLLQFLSRFGDVTRRMHNKSFTVDNQVTVVGGRNIGNEYFEADPDLRFGDLDVLAVGPAVAEVSSAFDLYWNSERSYPVKTLLKGNPGAGRLDETDRALAEFSASQRDSEYLRALRASSLAGLLHDWRLELDGGTAEVLYDDPAKVTATRELRKQRLLNQLDTYFDAIGSELLIFSPYFVPGANGVRRLRELRRRGVRVRVITNSLASTDVAAVHAGYARYRKRLLRAGVELYEIDHTLTRAERKEKKGPRATSKASLHAKSFVLDRERVFIGSLNLDPRSVVENTEIGLMIESAAIAGRMSQWFDRVAQRAAFGLSLEGGGRLRWHRLDEEGGSRVFESEPHTSFWRRSGVRLLRLLPIESQL
jgi:putative cardiolipin synthase